MLVSDLSPPLPHPPCSSHTGLLTCGLFKLFRHASTPGPLHWRSLCLEQSSPDPFVDHSPTSFKPLLKGYLLREASRDGSPYLKLSPVSLASPIPFTLLYFSCLLRHSSYFTYPIILTAYYQSAPARMSAPRGQRSLFTAESPIFRTGPATE